MEYGSRENRGDSERVVVVGEEVNGQGQGESCKNTKNAKREPRLGDLNGPFSTLYVDNIHRGDWGGRSSVLLLPRCVHVL